MAGPTVTIVTPSYQQAPYLEEALRSVAEQDYPHIEHIVVDGGSTDGSVEIIKQHDERLAWWVSEPDGGQAVALNRGFARATGELLGWLNSDDALLPGAVSAAVAALEERPEATLVYGDNALVDEHGVRQGVLLARLFDLATMLRTCQNHIPQPGSLFRRDAFVRAGGLNEEGYYYFDFELVLALGLQGPAVRLERPLGVYRLHDDSKSMGAPARKAADHLRLYEELFARQDLPPELRLVEREGRARALLTAGEYYYEALELGHARRALLQGLWTKPAAVGRRDLSLAAKALLPGSLVGRLRARRRPG